MTHSADWCLVHISNLNCPALVWVEQGVLYVWSLDPVVRLYHLYSAEEFVHWAKLMKEAEKCLSGTTNVF